MWSCDSLPSFPSWLPWLERRQDSSQAAWATLRSPLLSSVPLSSGSSHSSPLQAQVTDPAHCFIHTVSPIRKTVPSSLPGDALMSALISLTPVSRLSWSRSHLLVNRLMAMSSMRLDMCCTYFPIAVTKPPWPCKLLEESLQLH